jgi:hypothetical protein
MEDMLNTIWKFLGLPQIWGAILTIIILAGGVLFKRLIDHTFEVQLERVKALHDDQLEKIKSLHSEDVFLREQYAGIKDYSTKQTRALREAYLLIFEPGSSTLDIARKGFHERLATANQMVMQPLRENQSILDRSTEEEIYSISRYLLDEFENISQADLPKALATKKHTFFPMTQKVRDLITPDQIAYRLGLISQTLETRRRERT